MNENFNAILYKNRFHMPGIKYPEKFLPNAQCAGQIRRPDIFMTSKDFKKER